MITSMKKVIVLGGGVAGMSAAHELVERGYEVEVYDKNPVYVGGKARSIDYFGPEAQPYKVALPGEHGFRFFPGFYKHITDTMKRIPFQSGGKKKRVFDNLTTTTRIMIARYGFKPIVTTSSFPKRLSDLELIIHDLFSGIDTGLTESEVKVFSRKVWQLMTCCDIRINDAYERIGWWEFLEADRFPGQDGKASPYQSLLVQGLTRTLVAAKAETASTKTGGSIFIQLLYCMLDPTINTDRVLNGPTNQKWLDPWKDYLLSKGVKYNYGNEAIKLNINSSKTIISAEIKTKQSSFEISGDYFILAMPVEQVTKLISDEIIKADPCLKVIKQLAPSVSWMNGIQYYLSKDVKINEGHVIYSDTEWALTSISQIQFWDGYDITTKGNGNVKGILSVDISNWFNPGRYNKKWASQCTREEVAIEVWAQLKDSLNINGNILISDDMWIDYYLDRDIKDATDAKAIGDQHQLMNSEPLLVNTVNSWDLRPEAGSDIENLFFASDYVRTYTDLATMEGANEAARRAVNCILKKDKSSASLCKIWHLHQPAILLPFKWYDKQRWKRGLPWSDEFPFWLTATVFLWSILLTVPTLIKIIMKKFQ